MPTEILYSEIDATILDRIKENLNLSNIVFIEVTDTDYYNLFSEDSDTQGVFLIGEHVNNPFLLAQKVHNLDKNVSILIVSSPGNFERLKHGLKFTPFIGNTVQCIADKSESNIASTIEDLIIRTQQRRNYVRLKASAKTFLQNKPDIEQIRTEFLDKYLEYAPIGALLLKVGKIRAVNEYATHIFSEDETALLDKDFISMFPDSIRPALQTFINEALAIQVFARKDGFDQQYLEIRVAEIPSEYKLLILSDITEKVNANKKIEDQLFELKKINFDLDNFIYTASHDLKAPILNVEGLMNALTKSFCKETSEKKQVKKIVEMIFTSIDRFKTTIGDLSDISKVDKIFQEDQQDLVIAEIVEDVKISISEIIKDNKATILTNCLSRKVYFSKKNFRSIVYNLISNGIKYQSQDRAPEISIDCEEENDYQILIVRDNGLGIPSHKKEVIFDMFKRLHDHVEGSGIGLFIVKRIIENAEGKIEVESELGKGSEFRIFFKKVKTLE